MEKQKPQASPIGSLDELAFWDAKTASLAYLIKIQSEKYQVSLWFIRIIFISSRKNANFSTVRARRASSTKFTQRTGAHM